MPDLRTEQVTTHTVTLTGAELAALRTAARIALDSDARETFGRRRGTPEWTEQDITTWKAFARLGLSPTRSSTDQHANPELMGDTHGG